MFVAVPFWCSALSENPTTAPDQLPRDVVPLGQRVQRLTGDEFLGDLSLERRAVRSVLRHGFHPPEAQQEWSNPFAQTVHPEGRTPMVLQKS